MMEGLSPIDGWAFAAILLKAVDYAAALLAAGSALFVATFQRAPEPVLGFARRIALCAALFVLVVIALRFGVRAGRISGMGAAGMIDAMMLGFVWDSPFGTAAAWRAAGAVLVLAAIARSQLAKGIGVLGAFVIALSYSFVGHALSGPTVLLTGVLTLHLSAVSFWVGALLPLHLAVGVPGGAALMRRFGQLAGYAVGALVVAGTVFAFQMVPSPAALFISAYGLALLAKLGVVTGLLGLAALNKWRLVPGMEQGLPDAGVALRWVIRIELCAVVVILLLTATLTTVTTPPTDL